MNGWKDSDRKYSGPNRSGTCVCGHHWSDHHGNMVMNMGYYNATNEGYLPGECEFYGCNEMGGLDKDGKDHCFKYRDSLLPDEHN